MKQITKKVQYILSDTNTELVNFNPEILLYDKNIYNKSLNYTSGNITLKRSIDTTRITGIVFNACLVSLECSDLVHIYVNNNFVSTSRSFTYDNPFIPISVSVQIPVDSETPPSSSLSVSDVISFLLVTRSFDAPVDSIPSGDSTSSTPTPVPSPSLTTDDTVSVRYISAVYDYS